MNEGALLWLIPVLFIPAFIGLWCGVCFLIALIGGWRRLAQTYSLNASAFNGRTWTMRRARMGISQYKGVLTLGADQRGLYLAVFALFRPGHAPLYIPWEDIQISESAGFLMRYLDFAFQRHPGVRLSVPQPLGEEIAREANRPVIRS